MSTDDLFRYWSVYKIGLKRSLFRFALHLIFISCAAGVILLPLFSLAKFTLIAPYEYFFFGYQNNIFQINWIAVLFIILLFISAGDYFFVNIKRVLEPSPKSIGSMLEKTARLHLESGLLCANSLDTALALAESNEVDAAKNVLNNSIRKVLDSVDAVVENFMDTVGKDDRVTSNLMVTLTPENFDGRTWNPIERSLNVERLYTEDGCDSSSTKAWIRLIVQSHKSLESFTLRPIAFRVHEHPTIAIPGAGNAYHNGLRYIENENLDIRISAINDVSRIQWPDSIPLTMQEEAIKHFGEIGKIKSFISIPLIRRDEVVGILNINSSNYYLAGRSVQQRSILENSIFPCLPYLADMLSLYRRLEYGI